MLPYSLRLLRGLRPVASAMLVVFCMLTAAAVVHPVVHDHGCEPEECLVAKCLTTPQLVPEIASIAVGLTVVSQTEAAPVLPIPKGIRGAAASRGPPAFTLG